MTSYLDSQRTTDIKPEMLSGVQTGNGTPHDKYDIRGIAHARTNRKDDIFMQRRLVQNFTFMLELGQETCSLTKHTWRWIYSALWYFFPACCLVRFAAFFFKTYRPTYLCYWNNKRWQCTTTTAIKRHKSQLLMTWFGQSIKARFLDQQQQHQ